MKLNFISCSKNLRKGLSIIVILNLVTFSLSAQAQVSNINDTRTGTPLKTSGTYARVIGSPFLLENWFIGTIELADGRVLQTGKVRYDTYEQRIEYLLKGEPYTLEARDIRVVEFMFMGKQSYILPVVNMEGIGKGIEEDYLILLSDENGYKLFKSVSSSIVKNESRDFGTSAVTETFSAEETYYIWGKQKLVKFKGTNKALLKSLDSAQSKKLKAVLKKKKLNIRKYDDLVAMFSEFGKLTE